MPAKKKIQHRISKEDAELFISYVSGDAGFTISSAMKSIAHLQTAATVKKKKKDVFDARLDLHGLRREAAYLKLREFIYSCSKKGLRTVLIIHGKGSGALQEEVHEFLEDSVYVNSFCFASIRHGGSGATKVYLK